MSGTVWMSSIKSNGQIGMKQGLRTKFYGHEWNPAEFEIPLEPDEVFEAMKQSSQGYPLVREQMPEAGAVWNEKAFAKVGDILAIGGFFAVRGELAEVLSRFDLGEGGLYPLPIYCADLKTPYPDKFFLLNFGCRKDTLLPERSAKVSKFAIEKATGKQHWQIDSWKDDPVVLNAGALKGPDLWVEAFLYNKIFMSDAPARAIIGIGMKDVFALEECRVLGDAK